MSPSQVLCQQCGAEIAAGSRFCSRCGQPLRFCSQCGVVVDAAARFCSQCGHPQSAPAAAQSTTSAPATSPAPAPARGAEPVIGVIPYVEERAGLFRTNTFNLVLTPQRMVWATVTNHMLQQAAREAAKEAKRQGKGFLARMGATMTSRQALWQRYLSMPVEAILAEHGDNLSMPLSHIRRFETEMDEDEGDNLIERLILHTTSGKREFTLKGCTTREAETLLRQVLG